jgi:uncharacterized membrane protein
MSDETKPSGIPSRAAIAGHPIHPLLVPLPMGLFVAALFSDLGYVVTGEPSWATAGTWLICGGLLTGGVAAAAGVADFLADRRIRILHHAWYHLIGNGAALAIALVGLVLRLAFGAPAVVLPWGLMLSAIVTGLIAFSGWHGGEMVFGHGVGARPHHHHDKES